MRGRRARQMDERKEGWVGGWEEGVRVRGMRKRREE